MASSSSSAPVAPNTDDILSTARFSSPTSQYSSAPTANSVLSGVSSGALDPTHLHPLAGLVDNKDLDYLLLEDDKLSQVAGGKTALPSRGWGDELCYGTGSTYLAGLALGGAWGFTEGLRRPLARAPAPAPAAAVAPSPAAAAVNLAKEAVAPAATLAAAPAATASPEALAASKAAREKVSGRLRWNNILNQVTRRGTHMGNSAGVLALIYNGINSTIDVYRGNVHDAYGSMFAAAATGVIWRSTAGVKSMAITSGLLTLSAAGWSYVKVQFL
ncbi:hypothetical protein JCM11641_006417 [Rhodosporidiobolus odoratus]